ncbi:MAG: hypothetical protein WCF85_15480 [Rhodospirillaceae bacterium]
MPHSPLPRAKKLRVLIVDDSASVHETLKKVIGASTTATVASAYLRLRSRAVAIAVIHHCLREFPEDFVSEDREGYKKKRHI